jgi:hypothetical protein
VDSACFFTKLLVLSNHPTLDWYRSCGLGGSAVHIFHPILEQREHFMALTAPSTSISCMHPLPVARRPRLGRQPVVGARSIVFHFLYI